MKHLFWILILFSSGVARAQDISLWTDHLPYNSVNDIATNANTYFCATNQGLFMYDVPNKEVTTLSKLNGLNDIGINALAYNNSEKVLIVGYKNANIDLISGSRIVNLGDIKRATGYTGKKRINHILTQNNIAWLATGFGIVEVDLDREIVKSTYIIGPNGSELEVTQLAINASENRMYAATPLGLYSANMNDPLLFYQFWEKDTAITEGIIDKVATLNNRIFANKVTAGSVEDSVFYRENGVWNYLPGQGVNKKLDMRVTNNMLCLTNPFTVNYLTPDLTLKYIIGPSFYAPGTFVPRCASIMPDGKTMLIGNDKNGLIVSDDVVDNIRITPNGPNGSEAVVLAANNKKMYVATGAITELWTNTYSSFGIYALDDFEWSWMPPEDIGNVGDLVNIVIDPANSNHIFVAAWGTGVLEITNGELINTWNYQTTGGAILGRTGDEETPRTGGIALDDEGNLWVTSSQSERPISVYRKDGTWENFNAGAFGGTSANLYRIAVNQLGQKWIQTRSNGLLVMQNDGSNATYNRIESGEGNGNLPNNTVLSFAEDVDGEMWIGTSEGLVVLYSPENIFRPGKSFDAQPILFEEDGVVQRLLGTEAITAIAVDGSNKKWFGTQNSGVFYTSEDGTNTIHHFTADNSPLLSNSIIDIKIDNETGEVYFATAEGIVSFRGSATKGYNNYTDVYAYPNPVRPDYVGPIYIRGLVTNARIKITDVAGNLVFETVAEGGQASWDGKTLDGNDVASGVYMAYITDDLGEKTTVTKILVIR